MKRRQSLRAVAATAKTTAPTVTVKTLKVCCGELGESMGVSYLPGIVRDGALAAVRAPDGLHFGSLYHYKEKGREMVRLELGRLTRRYPLAEVNILGTLLCGCDERGCA